MTAGDRIEQFRADILASPDAMRRLLEMPPPQPIPSARRICLTGLGSSRYAADLVASDVRGRGGSVWSEQASGGSRTVPAADLTLVAISASGETREVVAAAERHRGTSQVIAVTNSPGSRLATAADVVVPLHAGDEVAGIAGRTFRATIAVLATLAGGTAHGSRFEAMPRALADRIATGEAWARGAADVLDGAPAIDVVADAALGGLAEQAALLLREAPRLPAHAFETAEWLHVGIYVAWPGHVILRYPGAAADAELDGVAAARGARLVDVPDQRVDGTLERAILGSLDAEILVAKLWARANARRS